jgi:hypothetical protein
MRAHDGGRFASRPSSSQSSLPLPLVVALWSSSAGDFMFDLKRLRFRIVFDGCDESVMTKNIVVTLVIQTQERERERERESDQHYSTARETDEQNIMTPLAPLASDVHILL